MAKIPKKLKLRIQWSKKDDDFVVWYPRSCDGGWILDRIIGKRNQTMLKRSIDQKYHPEWTLICGVDWNQNIGLFEIDFIQELENRGFDKKTLKFEVTIKLEEMLTKFNHIWEDLSEKEIESLRKMGIEPPKK